MICFRPFRRSLLPTIALMLVLMLAAAAVVVISQPVAAQPAAGDDLIRNGAFDEGKRRGWWASGQRENPSALTNSYCLTALSTAVKPWQAQLGQSFLPIEAGTTYQLSFDIEATVGQTIEVSVQLPRFPGTRVFEEQVDVTSATQSLSYEFTAENDIPDARLIFKIGTGTEVRYCMDNISLQPRDPDDAGIELLDNPNFDNGQAGWWNSGVTTTAANGEVCVEVSGDVVNRWEAVLGQSTFALIAGEQYVVTTRLRADRATDLDVVVEKSVSPWTQYTDENLQLTTAWQTIEWDFVMPTDEPIAAVKVYFGGRPASTICLDRLSVQRMPTDPTVAWTGVSDPQWEEIELMRADFGDPNDCRARVTAIATAPDLVVSPANIDGIGEAIAAGARVIGLEAGTHTITDTVRLSDGQQLIGASAGGTTIDASGVMTGIELDNGAVLANVTLLNAENSGVVLKDASLVHQVSVGRTGYGPTINTNGAGLMVNREGTNNCIVSAEAYDGFNETSSGCVPCMNGGNADGVSVKFGAVNNTMIDVHAYRNSDDGYDFWEGGTSFVYFGSAFDAGKTPDRPSGDGNGFKLGRGAATHYLYKSEAYSNPANGFDLNGNSIVSVLVETESYDNGGRNYAGVANR